ncbi:hypothetical protein [Mucilaginibacter rubeus]|uniref:HD-CE domain-containing protein n=1 Tax=Mucilaginibacter rubeus TaxID=2027860 RepID=A0A5C1I3Y7_9SPHI|nr:hypothetical protein [Mucilaginibacter rubeus]QEM12589.1 hypothetical protein DEO27_022100 [Mucilaginibacter rubeus]
MPELDTHPFTSLPLWKEFRKKTEHDSANREMVFRHVDAALPLLERIIVAFPKYTLHNARHQFNIIKIIGELLGDYINKLNSLEIAMLILSAVYHDIGMVYQPQELEEITREPEFQEFLKVNSSAMLLYEEQGKIADENLIGWYCRWMHAKRVWKFLDQIDSTNPFVWNKIPIKVQLGNLCESHNESVDYIKRNDTLFDNKFLGECDLTFCAILLRLADILDFDDTRTPLSVYEYLGLEQRQRNSDKISDDEWLKHMSSGGFRVEDDGKRRALRFTAHPENPQVEVGIRNFLKLIEAELTSCSKLIGFCSDRWRHFELPNEINKDGIIAKNYRSGSYHFSLAEDDVMKLLTGEGIYNDDFIFLRELLQNAIDTSRHREFREKLSKQDYKADAIKVSFFTDQDGYQWMRIDDFGMGMNLDIIEKHLLKKGKSYYNSDSFKLEKLMIRQRDGVDFVPISRFGIGLLSCFIAGDRIEINTQHFDEPTNAYRLSVEGRTGFFVLQTKKDHHLPASMPSENGSESGFRKLAGTSIAVRITTNKEYDGFDMERQLKFYLVAPPVPVKYNGSVVGGDFSEVLTKSWEVPRFYEMSADFVNRVSQLTECSFVDGIKIRLLPINLTKDSLSLNIKGQLLMIYVDFNKSVLAEMPNVDFRLELHEKHLVIHCVKEVVIDEKRSEFRESDNITFILDELNIPAILTESPYRPFNRYHFGGIQLSHNGIRIIDDSKMFELNGDRINNYHEFEFGHNNYSYIYTGVIYFQDQLLPDLTVSRNEIKEIKFPVIANVLTSARALNQLIYFSNEQRKFDFFQELDRDIDYSTEVIKRSQFYEQNRTFWDSEIKIDTIEGEYSIAELIAKKPLKLGFAKSHRNSNFYQNLIDYILQLNFDVSVILNNDNDLPRRSYFLNQKQFLTLPGISGFPPLTFLNFENVSDILSSGRNVNINHPYTKWYMLAYPILIAEYQFYAKQLIYAIYFSTYNNSRPDWDKINRILNKLRRVLPPDIIPPMEINLKPSDFNDKDGYIWYDA